APPAATSIWTPWVIRVPRPAGRVLRAVCVALPVGQVIAAVATGLHPWLMVSVCALTALEVNYTHRIIRGQFTSGSDLWRMRAIETGLYFVAIKAVSVALYGFPAGRPAAWLVNVYWWLDAETVIALLLALCVAFAVSGALEDFDRVGEAAEPSRYYISSIDSLTGQFFTGGAVLLLFSGLARVNLVDILRADRPAVG